ncbi:MAG: 16S rRNA (cytidine(1402)-2'-O)-methyltransferase [Gammaproteobacteria bacterium]
MERCQPSGSLYIVATPIGNLKDLSPRAAETLAHAQLLLAEDTRAGAKLRQVLGIARPMHALHEHNERRTTPSILARLREGCNVALISEAGTPLISDPGFHLVRAALEAGIRVIPIPGPCALISALVVSGLPTDRFVFEGFLPAKSVARRKRLEDLRHETRTMVFFEAPHRILASLHDMQVIFGSERGVTLARELTKSHETVRSGTLTAILGWVNHDPNQRKGEIALVVQGAQTNPEQGDEASRVLSVLLKYLPARAAAAATHELTGARKNALYKAALGSVDH